MWSHSVVNPAMVEALHRASPDVRSTYLDDARGKEAELRSQLSCHHRAANDAQQEPSNPLQAPASRIQEHGRKLGFGWYKSATSVAYILGGWREHYWFVGRRSGDSNTY
jgi:hypothetical protein